MNQQLKPYIFVTTQDSFITYLYLRESEGYKKSYPYIPQMFETMSTNQIMNFRETLNLKFLVWTLFNRDKFKDPVDYRIALCRFIDMNTAVTASLTLTYVMRSFLSRLESPFMDFYFDDKPFKFPQIKRGLAYITGAYILYTQVRSVIRQDHIFDLALEYKEYLIPGQLKSENCETELNNK